jgi:hypothetical protein
MNKIQKWTIPIWKKSRKFLEDRFNLSRLTGKAVNSVANAPY